MPSKNASAPASQSPHLLIVDGDMGAMTQLLDVLRQARYQISMAFDGMEGYKRALARLPQLIVLDVRLRTLDGFGVCRLLKADPATAAIPVIFLTAASTLDERLTGLRVGAVDYIVKPFESEEVLARIGIHLQLARQAAGASAAGPRVAPHPAPPAPSANASTQGAPLAGQVLAQAAARYLIDNLSHLPSLPEIARLVGTHEKRLSQAFREHKGMSVFEFVRAERLRLAQRLLTQTALPVTDIATETGFSSAANFATAFRSQYGVSPTEFRTRPGC